MYAIGFLMIANGRPPRNELTYFVTMKPFSSSWYSSPTEIVSGLARLVQMMSSSSTIALLCGVLHSFYSEQDRSGRAMTTPVWAARSRGRFTSANRYIVALQSHEEIRGDHCPLERV